MHVVCLLLGWCVVAHVLLLFPREMPLGINMVSVDQSFFTVGDYLCRISGGLTVHKLRSHSLI